MLESEQARAPELIALKLTWQISALEQKLEQANQTIQNLEEINENFEQTNGKLEETVANLITWDYKT